MNGDLSRVTYNPLKHFTRVVLQQGRVSMDADWNEQAAIQLHYLRSLAADLIGQHGGPKDLFNATNDLVERNCGFAIIAANKQLAGPPTLLPPKAVNGEEQKVLEKTTAKIPLLITKGHYYVDGLLCENESYLGYSQQPDLVLANDDEISNLSGTYLFYLDVWERLITALEDSSIREVALGGADTAARTKLTWQVRVAPKSDLLEPDVTCVLFNEVWPEMRKLIQPANRGRLQAKAKDDAPPDDAEPCITSPESRYRGMENQLYRVEVHRGGSALNNTGSNRESAATFKWSRDNGTIVAALKRKDGDRLIVSGLRDFSRWFAAGNWVEVTHDALELSGRPGTLVRLAKVEGETLTIDPYTASGTVYEPPPSKFEGVMVRNLRVRRWDHKQPEDALLQEGAIPIEEEVWIELEDGVMVQFGKIKEPPPAHYRTGDYWLIPARVSTGDVEWDQTPVIDPNDPTKFVPDPRDPTKFLMGPKPLPPNGVEHHYAPLAAVTLAAGSVTAVVDLRHKFPPFGVCS